MNVESIKPESASKMKPRFHYLKNSFFISILTFLLLLFFSCSKEKSLNRIAINTYDTIVVKQAIEKMNDQDLLTKVVIKSRFTDNQRMAFQKLKDPKGITRAILRGDHIESIPPGFSGREIFWEPYFQLIKDQDLLMRIVRKKSIWLEIRCTAIKYLTDPSKLKKIALSHDDYSIRNLALEKISDQDMIKDIIMRDKDDEVRRFAISRLQDTTLLRQLATNSKELECYPLYFPMQVAAVRKLTNQSLLAEIAINFNTDSEVTLAAIETLTDQKQLIRIAVETDWFCLPICKVTDYPLLKELANEKGNTIILTKYKIAQSLKNVDEKNRSRIVCNLTSIFRTLNDSVLERETGVIDSIIVNWSYDYANYVPVTESGNRINSDDHRTAFGEVVECSVKFRKIPKFISYSWSSVFPVSYSQSFYEADINVDNFLVRLFNNLNKNSLLTIANYSKDTTVSKNALKQLR